jgi:hypothetical protein
LTILSGNNAPGVPLQTIDVFVDGATMPSATDTTDSQGAYEVTLPPFTTEVTHTVTAVAFRGTALQTEASILVRPQARLTMTPSSLSFGSIGVGSTSATQSVTVKNVGGVTSGTVVASLSGANPTQFSIASNACTGSLAAGATCLIGLRFAPTSTGSKAATVSATASPGGTASAALSGTGITAALLALSPTSWDFGSVAPGSSASNTFTLTNTGQQTSGLATFSLSGSNASEFSTTNNTCTTGLAQGQSCTVDVRFNPTAGGSKNASLDATATPGGAATASLTGTGLNPALLRTFPPTWNYGTVVLGTEATAPAFVVSNEGDVATGTVMITVSGPGFFITTNSCPPSLAPHAMCSVGVKFVPQFPGMHSGTLQASASPGGTSVTTLTGTGVTPASLSISPSTHDYGAVGVGGSASFLFTVTNTGGAASGTITASLFGPNAPEFSIAGGTCPGASLPGGANCSIVVRFQPATVGPKDATLVASASPGGSPSARLTGSGV